MIKERDREIDTLKSELKDLESSGMNKDDRLKALEERYKDIIKEKDSIIMIYEEKIRDMS